MFSTHLKYEEALEWAKRRNAPKAKSESHVRGAETRKAQQRAMVLAKVEELRG